jgi:hypothetical protein
LPEDAAVYERLGLSQPAGMGERLTRRIVAAGLAATRA